MFDKHTLDQSREAQAAWQAAYQKLLARFGGDQAPAEARAPETHSGLPLRSAYFPHDVEHAGF